MPRSHQVLNLLALTLPFQIYLNLGLFPLSTSYVLIGIIFGLWVIYGLSGQKWIVYWPKETLPMVVFLTIIVLVSLGAVNKVSSLILVVQILAYYILFLITSNILNTEYKIRKVITLLSVGAVANALIGIAQAIMGSMNPIAIVNIFYRGPLASIILGSRNLERLGTFGPAGPEILYRGTSIEGLGQIFRAFGMFEGPTIYAWFSSTLCIFMFGFWLSTGNKDHKLRSLAGWAAVLSAVAVFLSWVRSAWLALVIGAIFIISFRRARKISILSKRWWVFGTIGLVTMSIILTVGYLSPASPVGRMILSAIGGEQAAGSNAERIQTARAALHYIILNPLKGVGFGNYGTLQSDLSSGIAPATFETSHNTFLQIGVELGLPGMLVFFWLVVSILLSASKLINQPQRTFFHILGITMVAVWLTFIVLFMFGGNIVHPKWMTLWWLLAGLQEAARRVIRQSQQALETIG